MTCSPKIRKSRRTPWQIGYSHKGRSTVKARYEIFDLGRKARVVRITTDANGKVNLLFMSSSMPEDVRELFRKFGYAETCRLVLTSGGRERFHFDQSVDQAKAKLEQWRRKWRGEGFTFNFAETQS